MMEENVPISKQINEYLRYAANQTLGLEERTLSMGKVFNIFKDSPDFPYSRYVKKIATICMSELKLQESLLVLVSVMCDNLNFFESIVIIWEHLLKSPHYSIVEYTITQFNSLFVHLTITILRQIETQYYSPTVKHWLDVHLLERMNDFKMSVLKACEENFKQNNDLYFELFETILFSHSLYNDNESDNEGDNIPSILKEVIKCANKDINSLLKTIRKTKDSPVVTKVNVTEVLKTVITKMFDTLKYSMGTTCTLMNENENAKRLKEETLLKVIKICLKYNSRCVLTKESTLTELIYVIIDIAVDIEPVNLNILSELKEMLQSLLKRLNNNANEATTLENIKLLLEQVETIIQEKQDTNNDEIPPLPLLEQTTQIQNQLEDSFNQLTLEKVVLIAIASLRLLPDIPPPSFHFKYIEQQKVNIANDDEWLPYLTKQLQSLLAESTASNNVNQRAKSIQRYMLNLSPDHDDANLETTSDSDEEFEKTIKTITENTHENIPTVDVKKENFLVNSESSAHNLAIFSNLIFQRLLSETQTLNGDSLKDCFHSIISLSFIIPKYHKKLLEFIKKDINKYFDISLLWLYKIYMNNDDSSLSNNMYGVTFIEIWNCLVDTENEALLISFLKSVPELPINLVDSLKSICVDSKLSDLAFNLLFTIIHTRKIKPAADVDNKNELFLQLLLSLILLEDNIKTMHSALSYIEKLCEQNLHRDIIEEFALQKLQSLESVHDLNVVGSIITLFQLNIQHFNEKLIYKLIEMYGQVSDNNTKLTIIRYLTSKTALKLSETSEIFNILQTFPLSCESLVLRLLHLIISNNTISNVDIVKIKEIINERSLGVKFIISILKYLNKQELISHLPELISQPHLFLTEIISKTIIPLLELNALSVNAREFIILLHKNEKKFNTNTPLSEIVQLCFSNQKLYTQENVAIIIQDLVQINPPPLSLIETVTLCVNNYPQLSGFVVNSFQSLINNQVWTFDYIWPSFVQCCYNLQPASFPIIMQLPLKQLENAFTICQPLKLILRTHINDMPSHQRAIIHQAIINLINSDI